MLALSWLYAKVIFFKISSNFLLPRFLSGWYFFTSILNFFWISDQFVSLFRPKILKASLSLFVKLDFSNLLKSEFLKIPLIASGGVGSLDHFYDGVVKGKADALLAASVFHFNEISIKEVKKYLRERNINIRD